MQQQSLSIVIIPMLQYISNIMLTPRVPSTVQSILVTGYNIYIHIYPLMYSLVMIVTIATHSQSYVSDTPITRSPLCYWMYKKGRFGQIDLCNLHRVRSKFATNGSAWVVPRWRSWRPETLTNFESYNRTSENRQTGNQAWQQQIEYPSYLETVTFKLLHLLSRMIEADLSLKTCEYDGQSTFKWHD